MGIFRFYNQNRVMFWTVIIAIIVVIFIVQIANSIVKDNRKKPQNEIINEKLYENKMDINEPVTEEQVKENKELVIDQFIKYCNAKNTQSAYSLLTEECKEEVFPTIEIFKTNYLDVNFKTQKLYSKERYFGNTYQINLYENMLNTGNINGTKNQDYYTIVEQNKESKINISSYVKKQIINRKSQKEYMQVEVVEKNVYMDYEIYELKITNLTKNTIVLDTKENTKTIYLLDENGAKYYAAGHEILDNSLLIKPMATNKIYIKYTKEYKSNSSNKLVFEDIILDYKENTKTSDYKKMKMEVSV